MRYSNLLVENRRDSAVTHGYRNVAIWGWGWVWLTILVHLL